jgi:hypothetical protein
VAQPETIATTSAEAYCQDARRHPIALFATDRSIVTTVLPCSFL